MDIFSNDTAFDNAVKLRQQQFTAEDFRTIEQLKAQLKDKSHSKSRDELVRDAIDKVCKLTPEQIIYAFAVTRYISDERSHA